MGGGGGGPWDYTVSSLDQIDIKLDLNLGAWQWNWNSSPWIFFIWKIPSGPFPALLNHFEGTFPEEMTKFYVENGLYKPLGEQPSLGFDGGQIRYKTGTAERERA